jgi:NitT/TauT family transport system permease protein
MAIADRALAELEGGLDALEGGRSPAHDFARRLGVWLLPRLMAVIVVVTAWQLAMGLHIKPRYAVPAPQDVWQTFQDQLAKGHITLALFNSVRRAALGYTFSISLGTAIGVVLARFRWFRLAAGGLISALQSLPSVTWVPIAILWFGLTDATINFVVIMGAFPSIANGTAFALNHVPPLLMKLARSMGAGPISRYRHFILGAALPAYVGGLKQAWSFSWRSLMAAELIAVSPQLGLGLGQLLNNGEQLSDMSLALVAIVCILVVGLALDELVFAPVELGLRRRRGLSA